MGVRVNLRVEGEGSFSSNLNKREINREGNRESEGTKRGIF